MMLELIANHIWQSTILAAVLGALTLVLRRNHADIRYWLWLAASMKFLVPFAALSALGRQFRWVEYEMAKPAELARFAESAGQPFMLTTSVSTARVASTYSQPDDLGVAAVGAIWFIGVVAVMISWWLRWRRIQAAARAARLVTSGVVHDSLRELEQRIGIARPTPLLCTTTSLEPGVFGIIRPVLLWPAGIDDRLDDRQIAAILCHELAHIRRRDNFLSVLHMVVQTLFWFYPLVWWIGNRLIHERERACDEEVVRLGTEPQVYAESVLKTCQFSVESPLPCVAGVTGSDLRTRIEQIMRNSTSVGLSLSKRLLLATTALAAAVGPVTVGVLTGTRVLAQITAPASDAPVFEAASIRPTTSTGRRGGGGAPGRFNGVNLPPRLLIRQAYEIHDSQIVGGPDWLDSQGFDINATMGDTPPDQRRFMMQTLLRDRFQLKFHTEQRDMSVYALVVARSDGRLGPGLKRTPDGECPPPGARRGVPPPVPPPPPAPSPFDANAQAACGSIIFGPGRLLAHGVPIDMLTRSIGGLPAITAFNRIVRNETGLDGHYDFDFRWTNEFGPGRGGPGAPLSGPQPPPAPGDEPALVTALQEQLGLKLDARRATIEVLVIDSIEKPSEN